RRGPVALRRRRAGARRLRRRVDRTARKRAARRRSARGLGRLRRVLTSSRGLAPGRRRLPPQLRTGPMPAVVGTRKGGSEVLELREWEAPSAQEAAGAQRDLQARKTSGKLLLEVR